VGLELARAMRRPPEPVVRVLDGFALAVRRVVVGHTPLARSYERLAAGFWRWWARQSGDGPGPPMDHYDAWLAVNVWSEREAGLLRRRLDASPGRPRLSIVMPVHDPPLRFLEEALDSVAAQVEGRFELCLVDDGSRDGAVRECLERRAASDGRIRLLRLDARQGIAAATNAAAGLAGGDYLAFLDHDDLLHPAALGEVALALAERPDADILYTDHDKIDACGRRQAPQFKPGWSPELLLSYMYLGHLRVIRRSLYAEIGGCRPGFDGAQDHDLALRAAERAREVVHVPLVLYHWRAWRGSVATSGNAKPAGFAAARRAIEEALARRAVPAPVERPAWARRRAIGIFTPRFPDDGPDVVVLIPTRNRADLLRPCLRALARTTYRRHRVVVVDNGSDDAETLRLLAGLPEVLRIPNPGERFSFAAVMNRAAAAAAGADLLLFLNDDTEVLAPEWLGQMVGYARLPGVGAVGAKLVRPGGRIDHAGIVHGADAGLPGHAFRGLSQSDSGYMALADVARNCSGVTAACLLTPRALFLAHGGFDEARFAVAYNDVDYCDRLRAAGRRVVYCPSAVVRHRVGASRGPRDDANERKEMRRCRPVPRDRYVNPHLSVDGRGFEIVPRRLLRGPRPRLSVLSWGTDLTLTGAPLHQLELLSGLRDRGLAVPRVTVVRDGPLREALSGVRLPVDVRTHPLAEVSPAGYDAAVSRLAEELAGSGADVVHVNTLEAFYAVDAAARAGLPCVWNVHEVYVGSRSGCWPPGLEGRGEACFARPYRTVFVSEAARASFAPLDRAHRGTVVRNVLDPRRVRLATPAERACARARLAVSREVVVLLLGTVCERKGQLDLVEAVARLPPSVAERARFVIVGERGLPYGLELRRRAEALPEALRATLRIDPEVLDPTPFLQAADVFLCTSRIESYPRVVLEAMAHGLPVVTTPVYGIVEQVREGVNALFYPPGDTAALASNLGALIEDEDLRRHLAAASRPTLESLGTFDAMLAAYAEVLAEAWLAGPLS